MAKKYDTIAIVGVGLIGGSIGLALQKRKLARNIVGVGRNRSRLATAQSTGAITARTTKLADGVAAAELAVVCTPVDRIPKDVLAAASACPAGAMITDAGSTKLEIVSAINSSIPADVAFVGSHPLAGSHESGVLAAKPDLFNDCDVIVTPTRRNTSDHLQTVAGFWTLLGARVTQMTPAAHDAALAATSHLPHAVAAALASATPEKYLELAATGWQDATRIASGDLDMWLQIFKQNRGEVLKSMDKFAKTLAAFRTALEAGDERRLRRILESGKKHRDLVGN